MPQAQTIVVRRSFNYLVLCLFCGFLWAGCQSETPDNDVLEEVFVGDTNWEKVLQIEPVNQVKNVPVTSVIKLKTGAKILQDPHTLFRLVTLDGQDNILSELETIVDYQPEEEVINIYGAATLPPSTKIGLIALEPIKLESGHIINDLSGYSFVTIFGPKFVEIKYTPEGYPSKEPAVKISGKALKTFSAKLRMLKTGILIKESNIKLNKDDGTFEVEAIFSEDGIYDLVLVPFDELVVEHQSFPVVSGFIFDKTPPEPATDLEVLSVNPSPNSIITIKGMGEGGSSILLYYGSELLTVGLIPMPVSLASEPIEFFVDTPPMPDGLYEFSIRLKDEAGNISPPTKAPEIFIDTSKPPPPELIKLDPKVSPASRLPEITIATTAEIMGARLYLNNMLVSDTLKPEKVEEMLLLLPEKEALTNLISEEAQALFPINDGVYKISVSVYDYAMNESEQTSAFQVYVYDTIPPNISIDPIDHPVITMYGIYSVAKVTYSINESGKIIFDVNGYPHRPDEVNKDVKIFQEVDAFSNEVFQDKDSIITITAIDLAGNETAKVLTLKMDNEPPNSVSNFTVTTKTNCVDYDAQQNICLSKTSEAHLSWTLPTGNYVIPKGGWIRIAYQDGGLPEVFESASPLTVAEGAIPLGGNGNFLTSYIDQGVLPPKGHGLTSDVDRGYIISACDDVGNCDTGVKAVVHTPDVDPPQVVFMLPDFAPKLFQQIRLAKEGDQIKYVFMTSEPICYAGGSDNCPVKSYAQLVHQWRCKDPNSFVPHPLGTVGANCEYPLYPLTIEPFIDDQGKVVERRYQATMTVDSQTQDQGAYAEYYPYMVICDLQENCAPLVDASQEASDLAVERSQYNVTIDKTPPPFPKFLKLEASLTAGIGKTPYTEVAAAKLVFAADSTPRIVIESECPADVLVYVRLLKGATNGEANDPEKKTQTSWLNANPDAPTGVITDKMQDYTFWQRKTVSCGQQRPAFPKNQAALTAPQISTIAFNMTALRDRFDGKYSTNITPDSFSDGSFRIKVLAVDGAGNISTGEYPTNTNSAGNCGIANISQADTNLNSQATVTGASPATVCENVYARNYSINVYPPAPPVACWTSTQHSAKLDTNAAQASDWRCYVDQKDAGSVTTLPCVFVDKTSAPALSNVTPPIGYTLPIWDTQMTDPAATIPAPSNPSANATNSSTLLTYKIADTRYQYRDYRVFPRFLGEELLFRDAADEWTGNDTNLLYKLVPIATLGVRDYQAGYITAALTKVGTVTPVELSPADDITAAEAAYKIAGVAPAICDTDRQCFQFATYPTSRSDGFVKYADSAKDPFTRQGATNLYDNYMDINAKPLLDFLDPQPQGNPLAVNYSRGRASGAWKLTDAHLVVDRYYKYAQDTLVYSPNFPDVVCYNDNGTKTCVIRSNQPYIKSDIPDFACFTFSPPGTPQNCASILLLDNRKFDISLNTNLTSFFYSDPTAGGLSASTDYPGDINGMQNLVICEGTDSGDGTACYLPEYDADFVPRTESKSALQASQTDDEIAGDYVCKNDDCIKKDMTKGAFTGIATNQVKSCYVPNFVPALPPADHHCKIPEYNIFNVTTNALVKNNPDHGYIELICDDSGQCFHVLGIDGQGNFGPKSHIADPGTNWWEWEFDKPVFVADLPQNACFRKAADAALATNCLAFYGDIHVYPPEDQWGKAPDIICDSKDYITNAAAKCFQPVNPLLSQGEAESVKWEASLTPNTDPETASPPLHRYITNPQIICQPNPSTSGTTTSLDIKEFDTEMGKIPYTYNKDKWAFADRQAFIQNTPSLTPSAAFFNLTARSIDVAGNISAGAKDIRSEKTFLDVTGPTASGTASEIPVRVSSISFQKDFNAIVAQGAQGIILYPWIECSVYYDRFDNQSANYGNRKLAVRAVPWNWPSDGANTPLANNSDSELGVLFNRNTYRFKKIVSANLRLNIRLELDQLYKETTASVAPHNLTTPHPASEHFFSLRMVCRCPSGNILDKDDLQNPLYYDNAAPSMPSNIVICETDGGATKNCAGQSGAGAGDLVIYDQEINLSTGLENNRSKPGSNTDVIGVYQTKIPIFQNPALTTIQFQFTADPKTTPGYNRSRIDLTRLEPVKGGIDGRWLDPTGTIVQGRNYVTDFEKLEDGLYQINVYQYDTTRANSPVFTTQFEIDRGTTSAIKVTSPPSIAPEKGENDNFSSKDNVTFTVRATKAYSRVVVDVYQPNDQATYAFSDINDVRKCTIILASESASVTTNLIVNLSTAAGCNLDTAGNDGYFFRFRISDYTWDESYVGDNTYAVGTDNGLPKLESTNIPALATGTDFIYPPTGTVFFLDQAAPITSLEVDQNLTGTFSADTSGQPIYLHSTVDGACGAVATFYTAFNCFIQTPIARDVNYFNFKIVTNENIKSCTIKIDPLNGTPSSPIPAILNIKKDGTSGPFKWQMIDDNSPSSGERVFMYNCTDYAGNKTPWIRTNSANDISYFKYIADNIKPLKSITARLLKPGENNYDALIPKLIINWQWNNDFDDPATVQKIRFFLWLDSGQAAVRPQAADYSDIITIDKTVDATIWNNKEFIYWTDGQTNTAHGGKGANPNGLAASGAPQNRVNHSAKPHGITAVTYDLGGNMKDNSWVELRQISTGPPPVWSADPFQPRCGYSADNKNNLEIIWKLAIDGDSNPADRTAVADIKYKIVAYEDGVENPNGITITNPEWKNCPDTVNTRWADDDDYCYFLWQGQTSVFVKGKSYTLEFTAQDENLGESVVAKMSTGMPPDDMTCVPRQLYDSTAIEYTPLVKGTNAIFIDKHPVTLRESESTPVPFETYSTIDILDPWKNLADAYRLDLSQAGSNWIPYAIAGQPAATPSQLVAAILCSRSTALSVNNKKRLPTPNELAQALFLNSYSAAFGLTTGPTYELTSDYLQLRSATQIIDGSVNRLSLSSNSVTAQQTTDSPTVFTGPAIAKDFNYKLAIELDKDGNYFIQNYKTEFNQNSGFRCVFDPSD